jgi:hypothetical protein
MPIKNSPLYQSIQIIPQQKAPPLRSSRAFSQQSKRAKPPSVLQDYNLRMFIATVFIINKIAN